MTEWAPISYQIDERDVITGVSDSWAPFALSNDAPQLTTQVVGRSLWEFVCDPMTLRVYRALLERVRSGRTVTFPYRCDSGTLRRFMRMTMTPEAGTGVGFESVTLRTEPRVAPAFVDFADASRGNLLRVCSWCTRIAVGAEWEEVEAAVERLGLFTNGTPAGMTHGMCEACFACIMGEDEDVA